MWHGLTQRCTLSGNSSHVPRKPTLLTPFISPKGNIVKVLSVINVHHFIVAVYFLQCRICQRHEFLFHKVFLQNIITAHPRGQWIFFPSIFSQICILITMFCVILAFPLSSDWIHCAHTPIRVLQFKFHQTGMNKAWLLLWYWKGAGVGGNFTKYLVLGFSTWYNMDLIGSKVL